MSPLAWQLYSLSGAAACLLAYAWGPAWRDYKWWNIWGSLVLLIAAIHRHDLGFIVMNGAWLIITIFHKRKP